MAGLGSLPLFLSHLSPGEQRKGVQLCAERELSLALSLMLEEGGTNYTDFRGSWGPEEGSELCGLGDG